MDGSDLTTPACPGAASRFVHRHTRDAPVALCPEIRVRQVHALTALWECGEAELGALGIALPFWAVAWPGGSALARWLLDHPGRVRGRGVLDLGSGSGLCAIAAARCGAAPVIARDPDPLARAALAINARRNGVAVTAPGGDPLAAPPPAVDVILAADLWYEQPLAARVTAWLAGAAAAGVEVLAADPGRRYAPLEGTETLATLAVPASADIESEPVMTTRVFRVTATAACAGARGVHAL